MKKTFTMRLLAILVCVATLATVTPIFAAAANTISTIDITNVDIVPVEGECPADHVGYTLPSNCHFTVERCSWWDETNGYWYESKTLEFKKGDTYQLVWNFYADEGYEFAENATVTINGSAVNVGEARYLFGDRPDTFLVMTNLVTVGEAPVSTVIDKIEITDADITPIVGEKAGDWLDYTLPANCHYTVEEHYWYNEINGYSIMSSGAFETGKKYDLCWSLKADDGYAFAAGAAVTINGETSLVDTNFTDVDYSDHTIFYVWTKPTEAVENPAAKVIDTIALTDIDTVPYIGENASNYLAYTLPEDCHYSVDRFYWYDEESGDHLPGDADTFEAGKEYSRRWNLVADEGYTFGDSVTVTINGVFSLVDTLYTEMGDDDTEYVVWMKPTAAKEKPATVEIKRIDITDVDLLPLVGDKTNDHIGYTFPENCHFTAENHFWYDHTTRAWKDGADDVFEGGHSYRVGWWLYADEGYSFAEFPTITINGGEDIYWSSTYIDEDTSKRFFVWTNPMDAVEPIVIDKIEIDGFCDAVVGGKAGDYIHLTLPEDAPYHFAGDPWWVEDAENQALSDDDIFEAGKEYTLGGWLSADKGYIFAENPEVLLNGGDYPVDEKWTERDSDNAKYFYVWGEPKEAVELIVIDKIEIMDADVTPILGEKTGDLLDYTLSDDCHFTVDRHYWFNEDTRNTMESAAVFEAGPQYDGFWYIQADSGYTFSTDTVVTINGTTDLVDATWTEINDEDSTGFYVWTKPTEAVEPTVIDKIEINGFCDAVVGGKAGNFIHLTLPEDAPYRFGEGSPRWYNDTDGKVVYDDDAFEAGRFYSLGGMLVADVGYIFAEKPEIVLNGGEISVSEADSYRNDEDASIFYAWGESKEAVEPIVIDKIEITDVDSLPIIGDKTNDHIDYTFPENCHFTAAKHGWYDKTDGTWVDGADDTFIEGHVYEVGWWLDADNGYTFSKNPTITINGEENIDWKVTYIDDSDASRFYVWTAPTEAVEKPEPIVIDTIEINGFCDAVVGGKAGDFIHLTLPEDAPYHFGEGSPRWYNDTDGKDVYDDDTFEAGRFYSLGGTLVADVGYIFAEKPEIVLNGGEISVSEADSYRNDEDASIFYAWGESKEAVEAPSALIGDANDDGAVNMKDVLTLRKMLAGMEIAYNAVNADCNVDGDVNMKDVLMLRKYLAGLITELGA